MVPVMIRKSEGGTVIAKNTAEALNKIVNEIEKVADLVSNISVASNEQDAGISQINQAVMQVSQVVQTTSATSEEGAAASEQLASQAEVLQDMVRKFRLRENSISKLNELSPEVLEVLEKMPKMSRNDKGAPEDADYGMETSKPRIILEDTDFGKY